MRTNNTDYSLHLFAHQCSIFVLINIATTTAKSGSITELVTATFAQDPGSHVPGVMGMHTHTHAHTQENTHAHALSELTCL